MGVKKKKRLVKGESVRVKEFSNQRARYRGGEKRPERGGAKRAERKVKGKKKVMEGKRGAPGFGKRPSDG